MTSEQLAACIHTNPVVIRRTLAGLRQVGLVASAAGHGGGWTLARDPAEVTLGEVCAALGERLLFAVDFAGGRSECRIEAAVSGVLDGFLRDAEALLLEWLGAITLADLAARGARARRCGSYVTSRADVILRAGQTVISICARACRPKKITIATKSAAAACERPRRRPQPMTHALRDTPRSRTMPSAMP